LPYNAFTSYALDAGTVVLVITYTLMLAGRLRQYRAQNYQLQTAAAVARAESRAKSELLAIMSHEIRTPMNGVLGMVELLQCTPLDATQTHYTNTIKSSGKTLLTVINDILDFSKAEAGKLSLNKQPFDLSELIEEAVALYRAGLHADVSFVASAAPAMPMRLIGDPIRLQQIIVNLLNNAFKFTERGEVRLRIEPRTILPQRVLLDCRISDTGIGIDPAHRDRLFQAFSQIDNSSHRRFGGTGLGLTICQRLVHLMEGRIDVESTPGRGSTFHFQIWLERDLNASPPPLETPVLKDKLLLAVDDREEYLHILREQARALGMRIVTVNDARHAAAVACSERPDIIAIDLDMPGINGFALDRELTAIAALHDIPRILLTASCQPPGAREIEQSGFAAAYSKPTSAPQLRNILLVSLSGRQRPADATAVAPRSFAGLRLLVAEDNAVNRQVIEAMLRRLNIVADFAADGAEAVELAKENRYAIILMDCEMPRMDGYSATRNIRRFEQDTNRPACVILALSAHALPEYQQRSLDAGMNEHLTKPISIAMLEAALQRHTGK
jgi:CheY-like chemotaxis protein